MNLHEHFCKTCKRLTLHKIVSGVGKKIKVACSICGKKNKTLVCVESTYILNEDER